jgi:hypothetical protein
LIWERSRAASGRGGQVAHWCVIARCSYKFIEGRRSNLDVSRNAIGSALRTRVEDGAAGRKPPDLKLPDAGINGAVLSVHPTGLLPLVKKAGCSLDCSLFDWLPAIRGIQLVEMRGRLV